MKVLILGGAGLQAEAALLDLLEIDTENIEEITLADRNREAVKIRAEGIGSQKVKWEFVDITNHGALVKLMKHHDLVITMANTLTILPVVKAALDARTNVISLDGLNQELLAPEAPADEFGFVKQSYHTQMDEAFKEAGIIGILGWGYVPGTSNILGRLLGDRFETIDSMNWYYASASLGDKIFLSETPREMIWLLQQAGVILKNGKYERVPPKNGRETIEFPNPIGNVLVQHMPFMSIIPEFARLYQGKNIKNIDVKIGYWPGFLEKMDFLESVGLLDLEPKEIAGVSIAPADVFLNGVHVTDKGDLNIQDYGCVRLVVDGVIDGKKVRQIGDVLARPMRNLGAMQLLTGTSAAVGSQLIAKGELTKTGLYTTGDSSIDAHRYFEELGRRNYTFNTTCTETIVE